MTATVLVVDDLLPNIKLLEVKLNNEYYEVLTAKNGIEAIEIANKHSVDIILLDVMMPVMDGFETCKKLKSSNHTSHIPVVMVTALSDAEDRVQGLEAGADDFLTKPIDDTALFARIRSLVRMKIMIDELRLRDQTDHAINSLSNSTYFIAEDLNAAMILIVDDDGVQAKHISKRLSALKDSQIDIITDPNKTIDMLNTNNYDLVIISTQITGYDSLRLCSNLRSNEKLRNIALLILVEENETKILIKALELGVNDYLMIPIDGNEVIARSKTQIKRKRYQDALRNSHQQNFNMSITDSLTGVYNRYYFDVHCKTLINQAIANNKSLLLLIADIDNFKSVNDIYGHVAGDEILKQISSRLLLNIRITDLIARFGGEEFVMVLPNTEIKDGLNIADRIRSSVEKTHFNISTGGVTLNKTISIGIARLNPDDSVETMLKRADKGLYLAKENGKNQAIFVE
jgi:two-component system cell cycle response regulator